MFSSQQVVNSLILIQEFDIFPLLYVEETFMKRYNPGILLCNPTHSTFLPLQLFYNTVNNDRLIVLWT